MSGFGSIEFNRTQTHAGFDRRFHYVPLNTRNILTVFVLVIVGYKRSKFDDLVKSLKKLFLVIPVKTGIQYYQVVKSSLDSRFRGSDDFLRRHQIWLKDNGFPA